ncbi:MAG: hypothetical protein JWL96_733 [Sphingomonas bacterium]|uniref:hypothetical protein n=1 Tax=Sphingomonas bacterium TaxID=1895847 RepID=UPI002627A659|nr:hypothetical protein [Sphingomonas bacterium]MDB5708663.1 hypothetical protein [Sphingomonas bacterium]
MFDHFMTRIIVFNILLLGTCGYAILRGGMPERLTGWLFMAAAGLTLATGWRTAMFQEVEISLFSIDLALLAGLVIIALKADRLWPMFLAALQLDSAAIHVLKLFDADMIRITYALMVAIWSYPMLLILAIGTLRHRRRLAQFGEDRAWSLALNHMSGETTDVARYDKFDQPGHGPWGSRGGDHRAERDQG